MQLFLAMLACVRALRSVPGLRGGLASSLKASTRPAAPLRSLAASEIQREGWGALGLYEGLVDAVETLELTAPSEIQKLAIPRVLGREDVMFAAETGSGKTLAYLLPVLSRLKAEEFAALSAGDGLGDLRQPRRPRAVVLVPTRELAAQVLQVAKSVAHVCKASCRGLCGNQIFNPTSMYAYATVSTQGFLLCFENSTRAIDSSKNQPNRLRFGRAREF